MDISIARLQPDDREVLTIRQAAKEGAQSRGSFLLCRPIGQEATRTAAMYRVISERLSREGCDVWRFDYHGTGDSPGEEQDQTLMAWQQDLLAVHAHAQSQTQGPVHWFGMGLGANLALKAANRAHTPPKAVVVWEPVLNGQVYVQALLNGHRDELAREFGYSWSQLKQQARAWEPQLPGDVLGFDYGPALSQELMQLETLPLAPALRRGIQVICALQPEDRSAMEGLLSSRHLHWHSVETQTDWMSSQAMGAAIVPSDALRILLEALN